MVVAFALCISLLIGSAFALTPSYQKVSMPDPYGIMPLSLDDGSSSRILKTGGAINYGNYTSSSYYSTLGTGTYSIINGRTTLGEFYGTEFNLKYMYLNVPAGNYDISVSVNLSADDYSALVFSGGASFNFQLYRSTSIYAYPDTAQFLVNGSPVGSSFACSNGSFTSADTEVAITSAVTSIGVRFTWNSADSVRQSVSSVAFPYILYSNFTDNIVYSTVSKTDTDYVPYFERVIAWEQSIYSAISSLGDRLSDSLGGVGESASKIASVFARDDDIQLRDDVDDTLKEVTSQFYDQTSTSSSSMTVETVQNVKGIADGMDAMFSSGYSVSDAFTEIADNDDFMLWFTAETAQALDSTGNVATVGDDDPYNMHYYYDQVNAIAERRGD